MAEDREVENYVTVCLKVTPSNDNEVEAYNNDGVSRHYDDKVRNNLNKMTGIIIIRI